MYTNEIALHLAPWTSTCECGQHGRHVQREHVHGCAQRSVRTVLSAQPSCTPSSAPRDLCTYVSRLPSGIPPQLTPMSLRASYHSSVTGGAATEGQLYVS